MLWFFSSLTSTHHPHQPLQISQKGMRRRRRRRRRNGGPHCDNFHIGTKQSAWYYKHMCTHIHTQSNRKSITMAITDLGFPHKELLIGSLRFLHTKNLPIRLLRVFFCVQRICPSDFWGFFFFAYKEFAHQTFKGFCIRRITPHIFEVTLHLMKVRGGVKWVCVSMDFSPMMASLSCFSPSLLHNCYHYS
jgi:hypothetical protein